MGFIQKNVSNNSHLSPLLTLVPFIKLTLSPRETEVMILMCQENSTKQIAQLLNLSPHTIESHKKALRKKTGSFTEIGVAIFAVKNHLFMFACFISLL